MEYDKEMAARVWKRVQGSQKPEPPDQAGALWQMIRQVWQTAMLCGQLARQLSGEDRQRVQTMTRQMQSQLDCLKGIYALQTGKRPQVSREPMEQVAPGELLRLCYGRIMQAIARYEAQAEEPEYGRIFRDMSQQAQGHGKLLLEILGRK